MEWLGPILFLGIGLLLVGAFFAHSKAKKKVMLYSGGVEYLINALKDKNRNIQIDALGKTKDLRAVEALIAFVNSPEVREEEDGYMLSLGLNALGETENPKAVDFLIAGLSDKDWVVRCYVCPVLDRLVQKGIKDFRAVEPLIALLKHTNDMKKRKDPRYDSMFGDWVEGVLEAITGKHFGADPEKWEKWWEENKTNIPATVDSSG